MVSQLQVAQLLIQFARDTVDEKYGGRTLTGGACLAPNVNVTMAWEVNTNLPTCFGSPMALHIINFDFHSGEPKPRVGPAKHIPTFAKCHVSIDLKFEFFQSQLSAEHAANRSTEDYSLGDTEFRV